MKENNRDIFNGLLDAMVQPRAKDIMLKSVVAIHPALTVGAGEQWWWTGPEKTFLEKAQSAKNVRLLPC